MGTLRAKHGDALLYQYLATIDSGDQQRSSGSEPVGKWSDARRRGHASPQLALLFPGEGSKKSRGIIVASRKL